MNWIGLGFITLLLIVLTAVMIMLIIGLNELIFVSERLRTRVARLAFDMEVTESRMMVLGSQIDRLTKELNNVTIEKQN